MRARSFSGLSWSFLFFFYFALVQGHRIVPFWRTRPAVYYTVVLNVYSGRPDPAWTIDSTYNNYTQLADAIDECENTILSDDLGYQGFTIRIQNLFGQVMWKTLGGYSNSMVEDLLIDSYTTCEPSLKEYIKHSIYNGEKMAFHHTNTIFDIPRALQYGLRRKRQAGGFGGVCQSPAYDPDNWNIGRVRVRNNCYNYAANVQTDTFAQPGRASGQMYSSFTGEDMLAASIRDGFRLVSRGETRIPSTRLCLMALVIWPGRDFHWYRLDSNSFWSHKRGRTRAKNVDESGLPITNPVVADRGPYTEFVAFVGNPGSVLIR